MLSGRRLDLLDPSPVDIELSDIAHGLSRVARWNGQTKGDHAFSVAQHSIVVWEIMMLLEPSSKTESQMMALLHDSAEYVVGDMISPFKAVIGDEYKELEQKLLAAIHIRFSLPPATPPRLKKLIKKADTVSAYFEATELAGFSHEEAVKYFGKPQGISIDQLTLHPLTTNEAQKRFVDLFQSLDVSQ